MISSFKGLMNVNAGVVNVNGPVAGVPGVGGAGGAGGAALGLGTTLIGIAGAAVIGGLIADAVATGVTSIISPSDLEQAQQGQSLGNRDPRRFDKYGNVIANSLTELKAIEANADRHDVESSAAILAAVKAQTAENILATAAQHDAETSAAINTPYVSALNANTVALHGATAAVKISAAEARKVIDADRAARGIKGGGISTSLDPRFRFLRAEHSGVKDLAVAHAIVVGFQRGVTPLFRKTSEIPRAIKALEADQRQLARHGDTKGAAAIGREIKLLKAEYARRTHEATAKIVAATKAAGIIQAAKIKDADQDALVAQADTTQTIQEMKSRLDDSIGNVDSSVDQAKTGIVGAQRGTTTATYRGAAGIESAIRANRPIVTTIVNVSATRLPSS